MAGKPSAGYSGVTATLNFGLQPLVHGPYVIEITDIDTSNVTVTLNGTSLASLTDTSALSVPRQVTLNPANTLEVTFHDPGIDSSLRVAIYGWQYVFAPAYPNQPEFTPVPPPNLNATGPDTTPDGGLWIGEQRAQ